MPRVSVIFLLNSLAVGGSERKVVNLAGYLHGRGLAVGCAYMQEPHALAGQLPPGAGLWHLDRRGRLSLRVIRRMRGILARRGPSIVAAVNLYPVLYAAILATLTPRQITKTIGLMNTAALGRARDGWFRPLYRWALNRMDVVIYGSEKQRALWVTQGSPAWARSRVIYNGVQVDRFDAQATAAAGRELRKQLAIPGDCFVFGSVGNFGPEKNQVVLIDALAELLTSLGTVHLLLAGDGPTRTLLEKRAAELGVRSHVSFLGSLIDVRPALGAMDVFVLPSTNETFSNAVLEAMAAEKAVILSDVGGSTEMVSHGVEGYLVPPDSLTKGIVQYLMLLAAAPSQRMALGKAARNRVAAQFSVEAMVHAYLREFC